MAFFDSARGCHIVRVVYDGPGLAGKTTNVQQGGAGLVPEAPELEPTSKHGPAKTGNAQ